MSTASVPAAARIVAPAPLAVRAWPLVDDPLRTWTLLVAWLACGVVVGIVLENPWAGAIAVAALVIASWRLLVPQTFALTFQGVTVQVLGRRRHVGWHLIRRVRPGQNGLMLYSNPRPAPFDWARSLYVPWFDRRDEMLRLVEFYLGGGPTTPRSGSGRSGGSAAVHRATRHTDPSAGSITRTASTNIHLPRDGEAT